MIKLVFCKIIFPATNVMRTVADKEANKDLTLLNMSWKKVDEPKLEELSEREMEAVTTVFRSFETGLREATIYPKVELKSILSTI